MDVTNTDNSFSDKQPLLGQQVKSTTRKCNKLILLKYITNAFILMGTLMFLGLMIIIIIFPGTPLFRKWYNPIPQSIQEVEKCAQTMYPMLNEIHQLSKSTIRANTFFQFGYAQLNTTISTANSTLNNHIVPILNKSVSTIDKFTDFVNSISKLLHLFGIDMDLEFVDTLNDLQNQLDALPSELEIITTEVDETNISGEALSQSIDCIASSFEFIKDLSLEVITSLDGINDNINSIVDQMNEVDEMFPVIMALVKIGSGIILLWFIIITLMIFVYVKNK
ncbi:Transmembrane protein [Entamoeba marina]